MSRAALARAIRYSLCFSLFEESRQIGFARVITDYVTYAYMCDVYVVETPPAQVGLLADPLRTGASGYRIHQAHCAYHA